MPIAHSRVTAQGQISVPAEVRKRLGIAPGSILEWDEQDNQVVVRRAGRFNSMEVHLAVFPRAARTAKRPADVTEGIRTYLRKRHARD